MADNCDEIFFENTLCFQNFSYRHSYIYKQATPNSTEYRYLDDKSKPVVKNAPQSRNIGQISHFYCDICDPMKKNSLSANDRTGKKKRRLFSCADIKFFSSIYFFRTSATCRQSWNVWSIPSKSGRRISFFPALQFGLFFGTVYIQFK